MLAVVGVPNDACTLGVRIRALPGAGQNVDNGSVNRNLLIDQVVRQTMVLIAQLATEGGARAPLTDVAERVFRGLVDELAAQSVSHKVIADMFGLALRTYYDRVRRATESATLRGRSLWEAVHSFVTERGATPRHEVLLRFRHDDEAIVKAVLHDLVASGLIAVAGRGSRATYQRVVEPDRSASDTLSALVLVTLFHAEGPVSVEAIAELLGLEASTVVPVIERLVVDGRAGAIDGDEGRRYETRSCLIAPHDVSGFEAAVFDHLKAVTGALCHRLRRRGRGQRIDRAIGGSTYTFDIAPDNPTWPRVVDVLGRMRAELTALREEADAFEAARTCKAKTTRFVVYCGQNVVAESIPDHFGEDTE